MILQNCFISIGRPADVTLKHKSKPKANLVSRFPLFQDKGGLGTTNIKNDIQEKEKNALFSGCCDFS